MNFEYLGITGILEISEINSTEGFLGYCKTRGLGVQNRDNHYFAVLPTKNELPNFMHFNKYLSIALPTKPVVSILTKESLINLELDIAQNLGLSNPKPTDLDDMLVFPMIFSDEAVINLCSVKMLSETTWGIHRQEPYNWFVMINFKKGRKL